MTIDFSDEYLAKQWNDIDWTAAEKKLSNLQARLSHAAYAHDKSEIERLQKRIVRDLDIKCLAVRHVAASSSGPGVDGVRWRTPAQMMRAALSLTSQNYHAAPLRQVIIVAKNTGKERRPNIPTCYDRAMSVLYGYSLIPVTEAQAERKSFAFRSGRSVQDALAYVFEALKGANGPEIVVIGDVEGYYSHIQHSWILKNVPMDKKVLSELLNAGIVFAGELFPSEGTGISEASSLSPYIGNFVLDGLQKRIFDALNESQPVSDFLNGNLVRFADDIFLTARTRESAEKIYTELTSFLDERGLRLSKGKSGIFDVKDGFTFLSITFVKKNGLIYSYPAEKAVERFIKNISETISANRKSQRELIQLVNRKLTGVGNYFRYSDATDAFKKIDAAVQTALIEATIAKHPRMQRAKVLAKYWYREADGRYVYALPDDKSIRVIHLADTMLLSYHKVKTNVNPFMEPEYTEARTHDKAIQNVSGQYKAVWERQSGKCYYCGRPILSDQLRAIVTLDGTRAPSVLNSAYIHKICEANECEIIRTMEDIEILRPYDVQNILERLSAPPPVGRVKKPIADSWRYYPLKVFFSKCTQATVTLPFTKIETILSRPLPKSARKHGDFWYPRSTCNMIAEAWITEGYALTHIDLNKEKASFRRELDGAEKLLIPEVLLNGKLPVDAVYELETHMSYVIKKYGLNKRKAKKCVDGIDNC